MNGHANAGAVARQVFRATQPSLFPELAPPRASETPVGRRILALKERFGLPWVAMHSQWIEHGESLPLRTIPATVEAMADAG